MNLQYISDSKGQITGVFIPINEWNYLKNKYDEFEKEELIIPEWHKDIVLDRIENYRKNPDDAMNFDDAMDEIENEL